MEIKKYIPSFLAITTCLALIFLTVYFNGCQNSEKNSIVVTETKTLPSIEVNIEERPSGSAEGKSVILNGNVYHSSLGNLWTTDPGETISRVEPMKYTDGQNPSIDIGPDGITTSKTSGSSYSSMSGNWGIFDTIWSNIKKFLWLGVLGFAGLMLLYFLVPAAQPVIGAIFRAIASVFPVIGSIVERVFAGIQWKKPLEQTVVAGQKFKDAVNTYTNLTTEQKVNINTLFNETMMQKQDDSSQKVIRSIKIEKGL